MKLCNLLDYYIEKKYILEISPVNKIYRPTFRKYATNWNQPLRAAKISTIKFI